MNENDSLIPAEWYEFAARDLGAAKALLNDRDEFLAVAGMLLQQAVENTSRVTSCRKAGDWPNFTT
jgi:hypothetical protein